MYGTAKNKEVFVHQCEKIMNPQYIRYGNGSTINKLSSMFAWISKETAVKLSSDEMRI